MRELAEAVSEAQAAARQASFGGGATELDFDDVAEQALAAIAAVPGVESALLETIGPSGRVVSSAVGLVERRSGRRRHRDAGRREPARGRGRVRLPLRRSAHDGASLRRGRAAADRRRPRRNAQRVQPHRLRPARRRRRSTRSSSSPGGPPRRSGTRGASPRRTRLADLDPLTRLHNRRYFHELLEREVARAHRYRRRLSLLVLDVDDFSGLNARIGRLGADAVLVELARQLRRRCGRRTSRAGSATTSSAVILPGVGGGRRRAARQARSRAPSRRGRPTTGRRYACRWASPTCGPATTRRIWSAGPTTRCARPRASGPARPLPDRTTSRPRLAAGPTRASSGAAQSSSGAPGSGTSPVGVPSSGSTPKPRVKSIVLPSWPISSSAWSSVSRS